MEYIAFDLGVETPSSIDPAILTISANSDSQTDGILGLRAESEP
jgi:hypothetical protein